MKRLSILTLFSFLFSMLGSFGPATPVSRALFSDLTQYDQYLIAIDTLQDEGILKGYEDGSFKPANPINRAEFVTILVAAAKQTPKGSSCFNDVGSEWFAPYVCAAKEAGIVDGYGDGSFKPFDNISFVEASKMIVQAFSLELGDAREGMKWYEPFGRALSERNAIPVSIQTLDSDLTRGEMAEMIWRIRDEKRDQQAQRYEDLAGLAVQFDSCEELSTALQNPYYYYSYDGKGGGGGENYSSAPYVSQTNLQEAGVDEADFVKNNASNIYIISQQMVKIVTTGNPANLKEEAVIDFTGKNIYPMALYLDGDRLVVLTSEYNPEGFNTWGQTGVYTYDVSNPETPVLERQMSFDGYVTNSRRVGDHVYLVLDFYADSYSEKYVPKFMDGVQSKTQNLFECSDVYRLPKTSAYSLTSVVDIPLNGGEIQAEGVLADSYTAYASTENLYFTGGGYSNTLINKFSLGEDFGYKATTQVEGHLLNQFSMGESEDGHLRVVTTLDQTSEVETQLSVLDENLKEVGQLSGISKGEYLYAARFLGDRAYLVTFEQVDPFLVVDLTTPENPKLLGELKLPGVTEYLQPYGENYVIGVGREVDQNGVFSGLKMDLFDVTDLSDPKVKYSVSVSEGYGDSPLLWDHKSLLFNPEYGKSTALIGFPVWTYDYEDPSGAFYGTHAYTLDLSQGFKLKTKVKVDGATRILQINNALYSIGYKDIVSTQLKDGSTLDSYQYGVEYYGYGGKAAARPTRPE